jgi:oligopeptide/dipeptide ABC transporter ATP-binding protein
MLKLISRHDLSDIKKGHDKNSPQNTSKKNDNILEVKNLKTYFYTRKEVIKAVDGVSFSLRSGETLGLAGESGCGKSVTGLSIMRLIPFPGHVLEGSEILFEGENLLGKPEKEMIKLRGKKISMVLQDPLMSLNPVYTIGNQVGEMSRLDGITGDTVRQKSIDVLRSVNISSADERLNSYPFQFSGGMRQRTSAAIAIARSPKILIADEPTSALDVSIQDQFLSLLKDIQQKNCMAVIMVTHDLAVIAETCDRVAIMYAGRIVETGTVKSVYEKPCHPYTQALLKAVTWIGKKQNRFYQLEGEPPNQENLPNGCYFHPRCSKAMEICRSEYPPTFVIGNDYGKVSCWLLRDG